MSICVELKSAYLGVGGVSIKLQRVEKRSKLFLGEAYTSLYQGVPQITLVNVFLFVKFQDVIKEYKLSLT